MKFGGTSVGTAAALSNVRMIVESQAAAGETLVVVVSALGGVTDMLIRTARQAAEGGDGYLAAYNEIVERHRALISEIVPADRQAAALSMAMSLLDELGNIYLGVSLIRDLSDHTLDTIVSYGERLSSGIISHVIKGAQLHDSRKFIRTCRQWGKNVLDKDNTELLIHETFGSGEVMTGVTLIPGFIAADADGDVTNLGRGGSDYTAAIMAAALGASVLEIWTDVDGFMTADPREIPGAYVIEELTYLEAMELCNYGAKVIYPPTIYPVFHKSIPVRIKNTFNPSAPGTLISNCCSPGYGKPIKGISSIKDTCMVTVTGLGMVGIIGVNARIFNVLAKNGISVFFVSQASSENNTTLAVTADCVDLAVEVLREEYAAELRIGEITDISARRGMSTIAIVGENMKNMTGVTGKFFNTLGRNGIGVIAIAQGASGTNISCIIDRKDLHKALSVIHDSFFLSDRQVLHVYLAGIGKVGRSLLSQIRSQHDRLLSDKSLEIRVVGISNSRHCLFDASGIDLAEYQKLIDGSELVATPANILDGIVKMNLFNTVFVDCTASPDIADIYADLLEHNVNVVAANKIAASSAYANYRKLKDIARRRDVKFLFETNVGAGLPVINTINSLINSGDRILKIEAVLSGTLNYIFNVMSPEITLSTAVEMAQKEGYCEPDPRVDLSGADVVRKIVILAREAGYAIEQADVSRKPILPAEAFEGGKEHFYSVMRECEAAIERRRAESGLHNRKFRFVAEMEAGKASVELREIDSDHPFFNLSSSNNVILLTTERYHDYPMIIKGYGAGADVTAAGVFADIISIANVR